MQDPYSTILQKHSELSTIIAKVAAENRPATVEETAQLNTLRKDIDTIKADFESEGRKRFAANLDRGVRKDGITILKKGETLAKHYRESGDYPEEWNEINTGKLLKGIVFGDWAGAALERKAQSEASAGAGGVFLPVPVSARVIDYARNFARVFQAGAQTIPMDTSTLVVPRLTGDIASSWTTEGDDIGSVDAPFDKVTFTAHKLAVIAAIDNELLEDAPNVSATIENSLAKAAALALDLSALIGSGTGANPKGLFTQSGVSVTSNIGAITNYNSLAALAATIRAANFEPNNVLVNANLYKTFTNLKDTLNQPMRPQASLDAAPFLVTNQITSTSGGSPVTSKSAAYMAQWDQLAFGMRAGMRIEVSREASYMQSSPLTLASAFSKDQTILRLVIRGDWQPLHPAAFAIADGCVEA